MFAGRIVAELYTKKACSLCQNMKSVLEGVCGDYPLTIREIDIGTNPALHARFAEEIPVLYLDGRKAFKYRVSEAALRRRLTFLLWRRRLFDPVEEEAGL